MSATETPTRQVPWVPGPDDPPQPKVIGSGQLIEVPAQAVFRPEFNYCVEEIAELANLDLTMVQQASIAKDISQVISSGHGGQKFYGGARVCNWIERTGLKCRAPQRVALQYEADKHGRAAQAEAEKRRAAAAKEKAERPIREYRDAAERCPALVEVLRVLEAAEQAGHTVGDVLRNL